MRDEPTGLKRSWAVEWSPYARTFRWDRLGPHNLLAGETRVRLYWAMTALLDASTERHFARLRQAVAELCGEEAAREVRSWGSEDWLVLLLLRQISPDSPDLSQNGVRAERLGRCVAYLRDRERSPDQDGWDDDVRYLAYHLFRHTRDEVLPFVDRYGFGHSALVTAARIGLVRSEYHHRSRYAYTDHLLTRPATPCWPGPSSRATIRGGGRTAGSRRAGVDGHGTVATPGVARLARWEIALTRSLVVPSCCPGA